MNCEKCIHSRICRIWVENEHQCAANYVEDCFEPKERRDDEIQKEYERFAQALQPRGVEIEMPDDSADKEEFKRQVEAYLRGRKEEPARKVSFNRKKLIEQMEAISAWEPEGAEAFHVVHISSYEGLMCIKEACGMVASALRVETRAAGGEDGD